jgi:hypothetical protein
MPEIMDSAGKPELTEIPALHTTPTSGVGSKTPPDPNKLGPTPPLGDANKAPKPIGAPGAPPVGGMGGAGAPGGAKPPMPEQKSPEEQLDEKSVVSLKRDINKIMKLDNVKDVDTLIDSLLEQGWKSDRLLDLIEYRDVNDIQELFQDVLSGKAEQDIEETSELNQPPVGAKPTETSLDEQPEKKPDNDITGVNPIKANTNTTMKRSAIMTKKIQLKNGTLEIVEASDVSKVIEGISSSRRRISSLLKDYNDTVIKKAGLEALGRGGPDEDFGGGLDLPMEIPGKGPEDDLESIVGKLKDAIQALVDWLGEGNDLKKDEELPKKDFDDLEDEMDKGEKTLGGLKDKGPFAKKDKKEPEDKEDKEEFIDKEEKDEDEKKPPIAANEDTTTKEAVAGEGKPGKGGQEAMDVTMGKKGPKGDKKMKDKKKSEEVEENVTKIAEDEEGESCPDTSETEDTEVSASDLLARIQTRLAEIQKEAQLYPFKDLNKQQVDNINAQNAKDQASTINSEIKGQPAKDKLNPTIHPDKLDTKLKAQKGKVSVEVAEKIRQHSIQNAVDKAKLSVELAAQQQLKGLIENPLRKSVVAAFIEYGVDAKVAEDITYNAFIDGYEESQKLIMKEAFGTFMEKDIEDFIKVAQFVKDFRDDKTSSDPVEDDKTKSASDEPETQGSREKTASVQGSPLRGTQVDKDRKEDYRKYWEHVSRERRGY